MKLRPGTLMQGLWRVAVRLCVVVGLTALTGCAITSPFSGTPDVTRDPFEAFNRKVFTINTLIDETVLLPLARGYVDYMPDVLQMIAGNFLANLLDPYFAVNNLLQGKPREALSDGARFLINSTLGFAGFGDPASDLGLERHREDFGQTLGVWGVATGPYLMLPVLGPSNVRDTVGWGVDIFAGLINRFDSVSFRNSMLGLGVVQSRARLLPAQRVLDDALDPYLLVRDSYLQRRRSQIYDGDPPDED